MTLLFAVLLAAASDSGVVQACQADAQKLCAKVKPGRGRTIKCLKKHRKALSAECAAALPK
jgi:hypothetical protein